MIYAFVSVARIPPIVAVALVMIWRSLYREKDIRISTLCKLADIFGIDISRLFKAETPKKKK